VVSANPPAEEHDVLRTCLLVGPAVSERPCSWLPWRSEQQSEDTLALRGKLVQESKTGEITPISEFFLQNHASPSRLLTTRKSKNAPISLFHQAQPLQNHGNRDKGKESGFPGCKLIDLDDCFARGSMHLLFSRLAGRTPLN